MWVWVCDMIVVLVEKDAIEIRRDPPGCRIPLRLSAPFRKREGLGGMMVVMQDDNLFK